MKRQFSTLSPLGLEHSCAFQLPHLNFCLQEPDHVLQKSCTVFASLETPPDPGRLAGAGSADGCGHGKPLQVALRCEGWQ